MKTVTTREAQHHFTKLISYLADGEEVTVTRRGKKVARILPPKPDSDSAVKVDWTSSVEKIQQTTSEIPAFEGSLAEELRGEERY